MPRCVAVCLLLGLAGCASVPDPSDLCGVWQVDDATEQWWLDGKDLRGEGRSGAGDAIVVTERLALHRTRAGHEYVATPEGADPTTFTPIDPSEARFGPDSGSLGSTVQRFSWANYEHDFPQEIHYLLDGDQLTAIVSGPERESGWKFERVESCQTEETR